MAGDAPDWCESFFSRMRDNVGEFQNILNQLSNGEDVLGEHGDGNTAVNTMLFGGMVFLLIMFVFYKLDSTLPPSTDKSRPFGGPGNDPPEGDEDDITRLD